MKASSPIILAGCLLLVAAADAFTASGPLFSAQQSRPMAATRGARPVQRAGLALRMGEGDLYEDDSDKGLSAPKRVAGKQGGISDSMRAKLLKENQVLGGDPDAPSINFAIVIAVFIGTLVIFGSLFGAF
mmetsp:Transcript_24461/g.47570  ORF Transcript_24461/g.47570 Transcript_24461/m.47570 type:complete len:130 (+) Transcript_24461:74-463(+)